MFYSDEKTRLEFFNFCQLAAKDQFQFNHFKSDSNFTQILDVSKDMGGIYLDIILQENPELEKLFATFATNDDIGSPQVFQYYQHTFSPQTLFYIKVLSDLINIFGSLDDLDIIEIGGGYGGQCKIIHDLFKPNMYIIVDNPAITRLQKKYLSYFDIEPFLNYLDGGTYDICISNYSFAGLRQDVKGYYKDNIIDKSRMGYFTTLDTIYQYLPPCEVLPQNHILDLPNHNLMFFKRTFNEDYDRTYPARS